MKENDFLRDLCKKENGKSNGKVADKRQDYARMSDKVYAETNIPPGNENAEQFPIGVAVIPPSFMIEMWNNGKRRAAQAQAKEQKAQERQRLREEKEKAKAEEQRLKDEAKAEAKRIRDEEKAEAKRLKDEAKNAQ